MMCLSDQPSSTSQKSKEPNDQDNQEQLKKNNDSSIIDPVTSSARRRRRGKRIKESQLLPLKKAPPCTTSARTKTRKNKVKSNLISRHENESKSGGVDAILPSLVAIVVIGCGLVAKMGWRGRATVAGIDLGTTNSVICIQQQSKGSQVGEIECIPDPINNSPIIPSVISFLDPQHYSKTKPYKKKDELGYDLDPSPSFVVVGSAAKERINTHPHHTLYHAKRVLGRSFDDDAVKELSNEVEFHIISDNAITTTSSNDDKKKDDDDDIEKKNEILFNVPFHGISLKKRKTKNQPHSVSNISIKPHQVGSYIINHLMEIATHYLGHDNVKSAVIAVPAKFNSRQRSETVQAYKSVGVNVARILEEPVAAALAYGLQKKDNVDYIIVYDFGGGTLDVSVLQVFDGGYVEVIGNDGDNRLGGADFDSAVAHYLLESKDGFGRDVVDRVMDSLALIEKSLKVENHDKSKTDGTKVDDADGLEEHLVLGCPKLEDIPLCSLSSLHTLGEQMKIELSSYPNGDGLVSRQCLGINQGESATTLPPSQILSLCAALQPITFTITSKDYDRACTKLYERSLSPLSRILSDLDLSVEDIDEVVMVGGTTRMPQIREMVKKELQIDSLNTSIDPDLTVAYGAASVID